MTAMADTSVTWKEYVTEDQCMSLSFLKKSPLLKTHRLIPSQCLGIVYLTGAAQEFEKFTSNIRKAPDRKLQGIK